MVLRGELLMSPEKRKISTSRPQQSPDLRNVKCDPSRNWVSSGLRDAANRRNVDILKSRVQVKKNGRVLLTFKVPMKFRMRENRNGLPKSRKPTKWKI